MDEIKAYIKEFYTVEQLSQELGISQQMIRKAIKSGDLKAGTIATRYIIQRTDIIAWLNSSKES